MPLAVSYDAGDLQSVESACGGESGQQRSSDSSVDVELGTVFVKTGFRTLTYCSVFLFRTVAMCYLRTAEAYDCGGERTYSVGRGKEPAMSAATYCVELGRDAMS